MLESTNQSEFDRLLEMVLSNPFIQNPGDEIGARVLMNWTLQHWGSNKDKKTDDSVFLEVIKKIYYLGAFSHKTVDNRIILIANEKYCELKRRKITPKVEEELAPIIRRSQFTIEEIPIDTPVTSYKKDYQKKHNLAYYDILIENLKEYEGPNKELQLYCPIFFKLLCDILNDRFTDWHTKMMISSGLAYFVLENDIVPDHEYNGYIDDLFIVSYVLKDIKEIMPELIDENWKYKENIFDLIEDVYQQTSEIVGDSSYEILRKVGLHKFKTLDLEEYSGNYPEKLAKIAAEKRELLGIVTFLMNKMNDTNIKITTLKKIHSMLEACSDYDEILRLIELSKRHHELQITAKEPPSESFKDVLEERLKQARLSALLGK